MRPPRPPSSAFSPLLGPPRRPPLPSVGTCRRTRRRSSFPAARAWKIPFQKARLNPSFRVLPAGPLPPGPPPSCPLSLPPCPPGGLSHFSGNFLLRDFLVREFLLEAVPFVPRHPVRPVVCGGCDREKGTDRGPGPLGKLNPRRTVDGVSYKKRPLAPGGRRAMVGCLRRWWGG